MCKPSRFRDGEGLRLAPVGDGAGSLAGGPDGSPGVAVKEGRPTPEPVHLPQAAVRLSRLQWRLALAALAALAMGALGAFAAACVRLSFRGLEWLITQSTEAEPLAGAHLPVWRRVMTPVLGGLLATVVLYVRRGRAHRLGREPRPYVEYVEAVRHRDGAIPLIPNCWRTLSAAFSVASGAAVGREGSMIQFAGAACSACGTRLEQWLGGREGLGVAGEGELRVEESGAEESGVKQRGRAGAVSLLVALGVAGGVTTAYNAPVASVFFVAEIVLGGLNWRELPVLGLASAAGWVVSGQMLGFARLYPSYAMWPASVWTWVALPLLALVFGILGPGYQRLIRSLKAAKAMLGALVLSGLLVGLLSAWDPRVWGNGDLGLSAALGIAEAYRQLPLVGTGVGALAVLLGLRLLATTFCVGTGTVGGVFTPTLFAGGAAGALLGHLLPPGEATLGTIVGMSCLMAAVTHAPLMAAFMAVELTGDWKLLPILLVLNGISWTLARRISGEALYAIASQSPMTAKGDVPGATR